MKGKKREEKRTRARRERTYVNVAIVGALGYGGVGAVEILSRHPFVRITRLLDVTDIGRPLAELYPHLESVCDLQIEAADDPRRFRGIDFVFFATPDGVGQVQAREWLAHGVRVIDYSGDFRFNDVASYAGYARRIGREPRHASPELLKKSAYGLAELHRKEIRRAAVVGNPGCFAVSAILGLAPAVREGLVKFSGIVIDGKTGVSGAGKKPQAVFHYPARYESTNAYRISGHQHVFEMERELSLLAGKNLRVTFTPHVVPMTRGILSTIYADLERGVGVEELLKEYRRFYRSEPFIRVVGPDASAATSEVRGSNYVKIWVNADMRTRKAVIVSHIDNLVKGQAGSAVQNLNVMAGFPETTALEFPGLYP